MDFEDPTRSITTSLDGPVLAVLAAAGRPLTVAEVAEQAARGSELGIRRAIERLILQGTVTGTQMGRNRVHELNRDHVAATAAIALSDLRLELWRRLRAELAEWEVAPVYACAFGSAARGDGSVDSDLDVLLVREPGSTPGEEATWQEQLDRLHDRVLRWTGNPLSVVEVAPEVWFSDAVDLFPAIDMDAIELATSPLARTRGRTH